MERIQSEEQRSEKLILRDWRDNTQRLNIVSCESQNGKYVAEKVLLEIMTKMFPSSVKPTDSKNLTNLKQGKTQRNPCPDIP